MVIGSPDSVNQDLGITAQYKVFPAVIQESNIILSMCVLRSLYQDVLAKIAGFLGVSM